MTRFDPNQPKTAAETLLRWAGEAFSARDGISLPKPLDAEAIRAFLDRLDFAGPDLGFAMHFGLMAVAKAEDREALFAVLEPSAANSGRFPGYRDSAQICLIALGTIVEPKTAAWLKRGPTPSEDALRELGERIAESGCEAAAAEFSRYLEDSGQSEQADTFREKLARTRSHTTTTPGASEEPEQAATAKGDGNSAPPQINEQEHLERCRKLDKEGDREEARRVLEELCVFWAQTGQFAKIVGQLDRLDAKENLYEVADALFERWAENPDFPELIGRLTDSDSYLQRRLLELVTRWLASQGKLDDAKAAAGRLREVFGEDSGFEMTAEWLLCQGRYAEAQALGGAADAHWFRYEFSWSRFKIGIDDAEARQAVRAIKNWRNRPNLTLRLGCHGAAREAVETLLRCDLERRLPKWLTGKNGESDGSSSHPATFREACEQAAQASTFRQAWKENPSPISRGILLLGTWPGRLAFKAVYALLKPLMDARKPRFFDDPLEPVGADELVRLQARWDQLWQAGAWDSEMDEAGRELISGFVSEGRNQEALDLVHSAESAGKNALGEALRRHLAHCLAWNHQPDEAAQVADALPGFSLRETVKIAQSYADLERVEPALATLGNIGEKLAGGLELGYHDRYPVEEAAHVYARLGHEKEGAAVLRFLPTPEERMAALTRMLNFLTPEEDPAQLAARKEALLREAKKLAGQEDSAAGWRILAEALCRQKQFDLARGALEEGVRAASKIADRKERVRALGGLAGVTWYEEKMQPPPALAEALRAEAEDLRKGAGDALPAWKLNEAWRDLAEASMRAGDIGTAARAWAQLDAWGRANDAPVEQLVDRANRDNWAEAAPLCGTHPQAALRLAANLARWYPNAGIQFPPPATKA